MKESILANFPFKSHYADVLGSKMHYVEQGKGDPILFLHGFPASCYIWRNIIPHLSNLGRCIAVDLIGMGKSDKPDIQYSVQDHAKYIEAFINTLELKRITFILHGWGSIPGFDYAMRHESNCKGLVFYEAYLRPMDGETVSLPFKEQILTIEEKIQKNDVALNSAELLSDILSQSMMRPLSEEEKNYYQEPFENKGSVQTLHQYIHELPRGNGKSDVDQFIKHYSEKLTRSSLPKLMLYSLPGFITTIATIIWAKEHLPRLEIAEVGEDLHFAQESNPVLMGETMSIWLQGIEQIA